MQESDNVKAIEMSKPSKGPSKTAETIAMVRVGESRRPEDERICYDPYAIRFISREVLEFATNNPEKYKAFLAQSERLVPGVRNSIIARVRYFDDVVNSSIGDDLEQLVILGAGYDTRAYRIEGLKNVRIFEVDQPATQKIKVEKIKEIFGTLPSHVTYVSADIGVDELGRRLHESGYDRSQKTLFIIEGLFMYLPPGSVDETLSFIAHNSGRSSTIVFDYIPESVVDGTCELEAGKNWRKGVMDVGEPFLFGIKEGEIETFLTQRGFSKIRNVTSKDYKKAYFFGKNESREMNSLLSFAYAVVV
ncbi:MAG: class I SAM-dependent methyltransferase [Methanoregula sp.]|jgi:methyltransferase (TIGR00027 family)|nr:class I SAM-dependent methyltransferase [Methanoregula sp.]